MHHLRKVGVVAVAVHLLFRELLERAARRPILERVGVAHVYVLARSQGHRLLVDGWCVFVTDADQTVMILSLAWREVSIVCRRVGE